MMEVSKLPLIHGGTIPQIGLGTTHTIATEQNVADAIGLGYRLLDTAENYQNEVGVGRAIKRGVDREDIFLTSKLNVAWHGVELAKDAWRESVKRLDVGYLDLFMIHWPNPGQDRYVDAWRGLIQLREEGLVRSIGVSNFKVAHLQRLIDETGFVPDVNQVQCSPYMVRREQTAFHAEHGIITEAWSPLGRGGELLADRVVVKIAEGFGRTPAQVVLRWHLQLGHVAIPRSSSLERLRENLDVFDFELSDEQIAELSALDQGLAAGVDSDKTGH